MRKGQALGGNRQKNSSGTFRAWSGTQIPQLSPSSLQLSSICEMCWQSVSSPSVLVHMEDHNLLLPQVIPISSKVSGLGGDLKVSVLMTVQWVSVQSHVMECLYSFCFFKNLGNREQNPVLKEHG